MIGKTIYDVSTDEIREATQADVTAFMEGLAVAGDMVQVLRLLIPEVIPAPGPDFIPRLSASLREYMKLRGNPLGSRAVGGASK